VNLDRKILGSKKRSCLREISKTRWSRP